MEGEDKFEKVERHRSEWVGEFKNCKAENFIISAEHLSAGFFDVEAIKKLKQFVGQYFEKINVIVYVRHYDDLIPSTFQQKIRNGRMSESVEAMLNNILEERMFISYRDRLEGWVSEFGMDAINFRPFDKSVFVNGSLLNDFLATAGFNQTKLKIKEIRSNTSTGMNSILFLQELNKKYPKMKNGEINRERGLFRTAIPSQIFREVPDQKIKLKLNYSVSQADRINSEIDYINQFFEGGYKFQYVEASDQPNDFPSVDDVPLDYYIDLVNQYNFRLQSLMLKKRFIDKPMLNFLMNDHGLNLLRYYSWIKRKLIG